MLPKQSIEIMEAPVETNNANQGNDTGNQAITVNETKDQLHKSVPLKLAVIMRDKMLADATIENNILRNEVAKLNRKNEDMMSIYLIGEDDFSYTHCVFSDGSFFTTGSEQIVWSVGVRYTLLWTLEEQMLAGNFFSLRFGLIKYPTRVFHTMTRPLKDLGEIEVHLSTPGEGLGGCCVLFSVSGLNNDVWDTLVLAYNHNQRRGFDDEGVHILEMLFHELTQDELEHVEFKVQRFLFCAWGMRSFIQLVDGNEAFEKKKHDLYS